MTCEPQDAGTAPDKRSFVLGMITAFSECVAGGCKKLALSPPLRHEDYVLLEQEANALIEKHGLVHWHEENADRPGFEWILIAREQQVFDQYLSLRRAGFSPVDSLEPFYSLLSYRPEESVYTGYDAYRQYFGKK